MSARTGRSRHHGSSDFWNAADHYCGLHAPLARRHHAVHSRNIGQRNRDTGSTAHYRGNPDSGHFVGVDNLGCNGVADLRSACSMERLQENASWTLLDPAAASDLGHLYSGRFTARYVYYEAALQNSVQVSARELWQSITDAQQDGGRVKCVFWCALNSECTSSLRVHCSFTRAWLGKNGLQHLGAQPCLDASATRRDSRGSLGSGERTSRRLVRRG